jgi:hypothetical protein
MKKAKITKKKDFNNTDNKFKTSTVIAKKSGVKNHKIDPTESDKAKWLLFEAAGD